MQQTHPNLFNVNGITYPIALDLLGNIVSAVTAPRKESYICLECETNMSVVRGEVKRPHFRHINNPSIDRPCNPESYIHKLGKTLLKEKLDSTLVNRTPFILNWKCLDCKKDFNINLIDYIDQVEVEQSLFDGAVRPDLTLFKEGKPVITLEVVNTHEPEVSTLKICDKNDVHVFVIPVSSQDDLVDKWSDDGVTGMWLCFGMWAFAYYPEEEKDSNYLNTVFLNEQIDDPSPFPMCWNCTKKEYVRQVKIMQKRHDEEMAEMEEKERYLSAMIKRWNGTSQIVVRTKDEKRKFYDGIINPYSEVRDTRFDILEAGVIPLIKILECNESDLLAWALSFDYDHIIPFSEDVYKHLNEPLFALDFQIEYSSPIALLTSLLGKSKYKEYHQKIMSVQNAFDIHFL